MRTTLFILLSVMVGCATATSAWSAEDFLKKVKPSSVGSVDEKGVYQMSAEELGYDCKKLTGRMQVRILQIRDYAVRQKTSGLSRGLQSLSSQTFGGTTAGADPDGQYHKDLAALQAYNRRLAEKKCRTFDLEAELKPKPTTVTPTPTPQAKPKKP